MNNFTQVKRYQIAKVYRRDQPAIVRGRFREFYQCDFDIAGVYDPMIPDAEILRIIVEVFDALQLDVTIKINHRQILDGLFEVTGVPDEKIRSISAAVDKLDKLSWAGVKKEMVQDKGLADNIADRIGQYIKHSGDIGKMLQFLKADPSLSANKNVSAGLDDMTSLASYLGAFNVSEKVTFDLSLARGLDYYTGMIFEVITVPSGANGIVTPDKEGASSQESRSKSENQSSQVGVGVGSIAAGGRYDNLVGMYSKKQIPCVGVSFGVDRIYTILEARHKKKPAQLIHDIFMAISGKDSDGLLLERMIVARKLWDAGIRAEFAAKVKPKLPLQFKAAKDVPLTVVLGQDEVATGQVRLKVFNPGSDKTDNKDQGNNESHKDQGQLIPIENLVEEVRKLL